MKIISRKDARALNLPRFYTGEPCIKAGHIHQRYTVNGGCVACNYAAQGKALPVLSELAIATPASDSAKRADLLALLPEHQFRVFDVEWPALEAVTVPLCLAAVPGLTAHDVRSRKAPTRRNGGTGMYTVRVPLAMLDLVRGIVKALFEKHAMTDAQVAAVRALNVREAAQVALEERPAIPEWEFK